MDIQRPESSQPIPPNARRVFKGVLFDVYQWEQELFDGAIATFEKIKRADTVVIFPVTKEKQIVIVEEQQPGEKPFISLPGGRIEEGEHPLEAARRELLEETGYASERWTLWDARHIGSKIDWANYLFLAKDCEKIMEPRGEGGLVLPKSFGFAQDEGGLVLPKSFGFAQDEGGPVLPKSFGFAQDEGGRALRSLGVGGEKITLHLVSFDEFVGIARDERFRNIETALMLFRAMGDQKKFETLKTFLME